MRTPYANVTNTRDDAAVIGIRRGSAIRLRCFLCGWDRRITRTSDEGAGDMTLRAAKVGRDHAYEHPETSS